MGELAFHCYERMRKINAFIKSYTQMFLTVLFTLDTNLNNLYDHSESGTNKL